MKYLSFIMVALFSFIAANRLIADEDGATITGKIFVPEGSVVKANPKSLEIQIVEQVEYEDPPSLPKNFRELSQEERIKWIEAFEASDEGKAWRKEQDERFNNRRQYKVELDEENKFEVENVLPGSYMIVGFHETKIDGKTFQFVVQGSLEVAEAKRIELEPLPIDIGRVLATGDAAPTFEVAELSGGKIKLTDFKGKYLFIDFWATWCEPCKEATPKVKQLYDGYSDESELIVLSISLDESDDKENAAKFVEKEGLKWKQGFTGGFEHAIATEFGINGIPSFWLIGPDGKILMTDQEFFTAFDENMDIKGIVEKTIKEHKEKAKTK